MMTQANRIRQFALDHFVAPARAEGRSEITIRAGDVHQVMDLANAMPAVCSAIGSNKFEELARATLLKRSGPANGANVYFHFSLTAGRLPKQPAVSPLQPAFRPVQTRDNDLDLANTIVLVSCVKSKLPHPAPARSLYTSTWFRKTRDIVEGSGARWFVLSSLYGLVAPDAEIAPYDYTLNSLGVAERRYWASKVLDKLLPEIVDERRIVMFAGHRYREFLVDPLWRHGITVDVPMANLTRGEQLAWLSETE
jgi:uncharacterized protein DUF6884